MHNVLGEWVGVREEKMPGSVQSSMEWKYTIVVLFQTKLNLTNYTPASIKCNRTHSMAFRNYKWEEYNLSPLKIDQDP